MDIRSQFNNNLGKIKSIEYLVTALYTKNGTQKNVNLPFLYFFLNCKGIIET